jgi:hypothetical protein
MPNKSVLVVSEDAASQAKLALVLTPKDEGNRPLLDLEALEPTIQSQARKFYHELNTALGAFGQSGLKIGKILSEARSAFKPLGIWIAFLNRVPGLSAKSGDRFIKRYEMAQKQLSSTLVSIVTATGIDMAGEDAKHPFGKYTKAVKKVGNPPKDTGDEEKDTERARVWLARVMVIRSKEQKQARLRSQGADPTEKASAVLVRLVENYVEDRTGQVSFLKRVVQTTLKRLGHNDMVVVPAGKGLKIAA